MTANPHARHPWAVQTIVVDGNHPIRFLERDWRQHGGDLTQGQWEAILPRIVGILNQCTLLELCCSVGPDYRLTTCEEAIAALDCYLVIMLGRTIVRARRDPKRVAEEERDHIDALEWAVRTLMCEAVVVPRIQKIVGAAMTCQLGRTVAVGNLFAHGGAQFGASTISLPKAAENKILTAGMKGYRCLDLNFFECHMESNLNKLLEGRQWLACLAMIDMQVASWLTQAAQHLTN